MTLLRLGVAMVVGLAGALLVGGCAVTAQRAGTDAAQPLRSPQGHRIEVARSYEHEIKTADGPQTQVVEWGWDYTEAVAYEKTSTPDGRELSYRHVPGQILRASEREQARAYELVKRHPELAATAALPGAAFEGGFILMEPDDLHCHLRSRCVYVLVSQDRGRTKIIQAIVDLQTGQVVYPHFDPSMIGTQNQNSEGQP